MAAIDDAVDVVAQKRQDSQMVASMLASMSEQMRGSAGAGIDPTPGAEGNLAAKAATPSPVELVAAKTAAPAGGASAVAPRAAPVGADLQAYMRAASTEESGGNPNIVNGRTGAHGTFQIMPDNWAGWAKEAGVDPSDRSAAAQNQVAAHKMQEYYDKYHSWGAVAVAWYAGEGLVKRWLADPTAKIFTRKQGKGNEPSINEYVDNIVGNMHVGTPAPAPAAGAPSAPVPAVATRPADAAPTAPAAPDLTDRNPDLNAFTLALSGGTPAGTAGKAGTFQIAPTNYTAWAKNAGVNPTDKTPEAQWKVATTQMQSYFEHYQDWGAVAVAWYAGPGKVTAWLRNPHDPQFDKPMNGNGPSVNQYVQQTLAKMRTAAS